MRPVRSGIVDTLIGFRAERHFKQIAALRASEQQEHHPHGYMFRDIPPELTASDDPTACVQETLALMDRHGVEYGLISLTDERSAQALRDHPKRFVGSLAVDGNRGTDQVRDIVKAYEEHRIGAVTIFPSGVSPQIPINDKLWYPIYAKCVELDLPVFVTVGVPGPRVKMMAQYVGLLDEVCFDLPELKLVMRHGAQPWEDLAVKLMLKWPNLYYSTSAFAPKYIPQAIIDFANTRGSEKILYAGYFPFGLELDRIFSELDELPLRPEVWPKFLSLNARKLLKLPVNASAARATPIHGEQHVQ
jgi:predicted TIM-barrel fold metal-dependent hydrolase